MGNERAGELDQVDLAPVDRGDHRPQHEGEVARLRRALEQATNEFGADEGFLSRRSGWLSLGYWLVARRSSSCPRRRAAASHRPLACADRLTASPGGKAPPQVSPDRWN